LLQSFGLAFQGQKGHKTFIDDLDDFFSGPQAKIDE